MLHRIASAMASGLLLTLTTSLMAQTRADLDRNDALEVADLQEFQRLFEAEDRRADFNRDGAHDLVDLLEFQNELVAGGSGGVTDTSFGTLRIGLGSGVSADRATYDWGETSDGIVWLTQTTLQIRAARHYETGLGGHFAHIDFGWTGGGSGVPASAVAPGGNPNDWRFRYQGIDPEQDAVDAWINHVIAVVGTVISDYEMAYGTGTADGLKILFDNETIMDRGAKVGFGLQTTRWSRANFTGFTGFVDRYSEIATPVMTALMDAVSSTYPNVDFGWYGIPHHSRYGSLSGHETEIVQPWDPFYYDGKDAASYDLLTHSQFMDAHSYGNPVLTTHPVSFEAHYHDKNLGRMKGVADDVGEIIGGDFPPVASHWLTMGKADEHDRIQSFFEACVTHGITDAVIYGDWNGFKCRAAFAGMAPPGLWHTLIISAAREAQFLDGPSISDLTLVNVTPDSAKAGNTVTIELGGSGFDSNTTLSISGSGATIAGLTVADPNAMTATLTVSGSATPSVRDMTVHKGSDSWTVDGGFQIRGATDPAWAPVLSCILPDSVEVGSSHKIEVAGLHFQSNCVAIVSPSTDITVDGVTFHHSKRVDVDITVAAGAATGTRSLQIWNADGWGEIDLEITSP